MDYHYTSSNILEEDRCVLVFFVHTAYISEVSGETGHSVLQTAFTGLMLYLLVITMRFRNGVLRGWSNFCVLEKTFDTEFRCAEVCFVLCIFCNISRSTVN